MNNTLSSALRNERSLADAMYRTIRWRLMPFLMLCYVLAFIDRANVGFAKLHFLRDLGFSEADYGFGSGIFYLGYILFEIPSNFYLQRAGVRRTLLRIMALWGVCCAALALMTTPVHYYGLRFLLGAAEAGLFPGILLYLTYWVPGARRARFTALFMAAIPVAGLLGGPLAGWIMGGMANTAGLKGWQWLFIIEGLPAVGVGVWAYFYLQDGPAQSGWLTPTQKSLLARELEADHMAQAPHRVRAFKDAWRDPKVYLLIAMAFSVQVSCNGVFIWLPSILNRSGLADATAIGLLSVVPFAVGLVAQFLNARHSDRTLERRLHVAVPAALASLGWLLLTQVNNQPVLALLMLTVVTAGTLAAMGPLWSLPAAFLSGSAAAGGIALISALSGIGNMISPMLVGWLAAKTGTLSAGQYYFSILLGIGVVCAVALPRTSGALKNRKKDGR